MRCRQQPKWGEIIYKIVLHENQKIGSRTMSEQKYFEFLRTFRCVKGTSERILPYYATVVMEATRNFAFTDVPSQGQLQRWTEHSTLIFENLKPVEKKNHFSII